MKKEKIKYPIQMESKQNGLVVEFTDENTGTIIKNPNKCEYNEIGDIHGCWISATNSNTWRVYNPPKEKDANPEMEYPVLMEQIIESVLETCFTSKANEILEDLSKKVNTLCEAKIEIGKHFTSKESDLLQYAIDQSNMNVTGTNGSDKKEADRIFAQAGGVLSPLHSQIAGTHYKDMPIQPIEFIQKNGLSYAQGSIIKYICRYKSKNGAEDLKKAIHFIELLMEIEYGDTART